MLRAGQVLYHGTEAKSWPLLHVTVGSMVTPYCPNLTDWEPSWTRRFGRTRFDAPFRRSVWTPRLDAPFGRHLCHCEIMPRDRHKTAFLHSRDRSACQAMQYRTGESGKEKRGKKVYGEVLILDLEQGTRVHATVCETDFINNTFAAPAHRTKGFGRCDHGAAVEDAIELG